GNGADQILNPDGAEPAEGEQAKPTVPCRESGCPTPESYDAEELTRLLGVLKDEFPNEENVILVPEGRIEYEVLVRTMDATREDSSRTGEDSKARLLFPFVVIAGGAE